MLNVETIKKGNTVVTITSTHRIPNDLIKRVKLVVEEDEEEYITFDEFEKDYRASTKEKETIGHKIKLARLKKKISQTELARAIEMKQPQLSAIEMGKHVPSMKTLKKIANGLGMDVEELV